MSMVRVYVAGPMRGGGERTTLKNVFVAVEAGNRLMDAGFNVHLPHLDIFQSLWDGKTDDYATWRAADEDWLSACHAVLRLPGYSVGADAEVEFAESLGIPVFTTVEDLIEHGPASLQEVHA